MTADENKKFNESITMALQQIAQIAFAPPCPLSDEVMIRIPMNHFQDLLACGAALNLAVNLPPGEGLVIKRAISERYEAESKFFFDLLNQIREQIQGSLSPKH